MPITINCDMGEGVGNDHLLVPFINCANIACGYHAGDAETIKRTIELCVRHRVAVGAHPSFFDRENFGRKEVDLSLLEIYELVTQQLYIFRELADMLNEPIMHVKPHGALYNLSARSTTVARGVATAIKDFDIRLILVGLSGSHSIEAAHAIGLQTAHEVFADRSYQDDGSLTPRSQPGALLDEAQATRQVLQIIREGTLSTITGKTLPVRADTVCIHGDHIHAVSMAKSIHAVLEQETSRTNH